MLHRSSQAGRPRLRAAVALSAVLAFGLGACGSDSDAAGGDKTPEELVVGLSALPIGVDPVQYNDSETQMVYRLVNEPLFRYTGPGEISPLLAEKMPEVSEDGKTWTIQLKKGVEFTNGDPFNADDVIHTFETILDTDNGSYNRSALVALDKVEAVDEHTIKLTLSYAFSPLLYQLTRLAIVSDTIPYEQGKTYATTLVGTGPYKLDSVKRGQEIKLVANENFREEGVPTIPAIMVKAYPDSNSQLTALKTGEVHVLPQVQPAAVDTIKKFATIHQSDSKLVSTRFWFWPNQGDGLMKDQNLRKAVTLAIDRGRVVDNTLRGYGVPISTIPSAYDDGDLFMSPLAQAYGRDAQIDEAKKLVEAAGATGKELHMVVPDGPTIPAVADSVQQQLEEVGFKVKREDLTQAAALDRIFNNNYDLYLNGNTSAAEDSGLDGAFGLYGIGGAYNLNGVNDKELDKLVRESVEALTPEAAVDVVEKMRQRQLEYVPDMPIAIGYDLTALAKGLDGFEINNFGDFYGFAYMK
ncbi:ABC transporter substrate-binding protein [Nocardioides sp. W7]|uniref:ABC transporter substrate-binding protein n=1 Tax=Nocardioides sp. W7 TaxID=2931390 RepID=UPI001FD14554|nr:ABC transporter substrate-binding protein [Nocardioides sp. W7]